MRFAILATAGLLAVAGAFPVFGHAGLLTSDPADGDTISTPYTLVATFEEELDPERSSLTVFDAADEQVAHGEVDSDDPSMMFVELPELEPGEYIVRWTTVTPDDDGVDRGEFTFNVIAAQQTIEPTTAPTTSAPTPAPTGTTGGGQSADNNDVLLALAFAGVALAGIGLFVFNRTRR